MERTGELNEDHQNRELEAIISKEWEKALSRQNQQNLNRDSKDKLENWEAEPSNTAFTWGAGWTEVTRDKTSKVIKVGKSYKNFNLISITIIQDSQRIPGLRGQLQEDQKSSSWCTGGANLMPSCKGGKCLNCFAR